MSLKMNWQILDSNSLAKIKKIYNSKYTFTPVGATKFNQLFKKVQCTVTDRFMKPKKKMLNDESLVNGHCDFTKKIANKHVLQFHK